MSKTDVQSIVLNNSVMDPGSRVFLPQGSGMIFYPDLRSLTCLKKHEILKFPF
jgi:hypothetical protein